VANSFCSGLTSSKLFFLPYEVYSGAWPPASVHHTCVVRSLFVRDLLHHIVCVHCMLQGAALWQQLLQRDHSQRVLLPPYHADFVLVPNNQQLSVPSRL
jgi:hypothetical protein